MHGFTFRAVCCVVCQHWQISVDVNVYILHVCAKTSYVTLNVENLCWHIAGDHCKQEQDVYFLTPINT